MSQPELGSQVPFFLNTFLSKPASALPKGAQWVLSFDGTYTPANRGGNLASGQGGVQVATSPLNNVVPVTAILRGVRLEPQRWDIQGGLNTLLARDYQQTKGCLFAQGVMLPGESSIANPEGVQTNGFIRTYSGGGRNSFPALQVSFLETNISFVDNVLRPWTIATAHLGLIARFGAENYRGVLTVYKLGILSNTTTPYVASKYTFYGVCPIEVSGEDLTYNSTTVPTTRVVSFIYHYYTFETNPRNPAVFNNTANYPVPLATNRREVSISLNRATTP
jgi:hypothetical protein